MGNILDVLNCTKVLQFSCFCVNSVNNQASNNNDTVITSLTLWADSNLFQSSDTAEFQILVTLYDAANNWFFGSTWKGPLLPASDVIGGRAKVVLNEVSNKKIL